MSDTELEIALAISRHDAEEQRRQEEARRLDWLDNSVALALENSEGWMCARCTLDNPSDVGRCQACLADRETLQVSESTGQRTRCGLPGCNRHATGGFCSDDHARRASERGLAAPAADDIERCYVGQNGEYSVSVLTRSSAKRADIAAHFVRAWRKGALPTVKHVFKVCPAPALRERFERYQAAVGNVRWRYHGTSSACDFGVNLAAAPCDRQECALCNILAHGFRLSKAGTGPNGHIRSLRYGCGIYLSATSGKSNDYAFNTERKRRGKRGRTERWRCMFVCSVAAGKAFRTTDGQLFLTNRAPPGYDSVVGEVGDNLNYDELVVYSEAAVLPEFLVIYTVTEG